MARTKVKSVEVEEVFISEIADNKDFSSTTLKIKALKNELNQLFLERETLIDLLLSCLISEYGIFIGGMPGTGKTALAKAITDAFNGKSCYRLLQASSTLEEIIGAVDLTALDKGLFCRKLENGAVLADTLILDEGFKANSPVLNALLGLILDKSYQNGDDGEVKSPLKMTVVCSNELPQDEGLAAFWDRLVVRYWVNELQPSNRMILMKRRAGTLPIPPVTTQLSLQELEALKNQSKLITIDDDVIFSIIQITDYLRKECNIVVSDRKHEQIIDLIKSYALVLGKISVDEDCLDILKHCCWDEASQQEKVIQGLQKFGNPLTMKAKQKWEACEILFSQLGRFNSSLNASVYQLQAVQTKNKIVEALDLLNDEIGRIKSKSKTKAARDYAAKINGFIFQIDEYMVESFNLPTKPQESSSPVPF